MKKYGIFLGGVAICFGVAGVSVLLEELIPGGLSVNTVLSVGKMTFFVMIFTFAMCFGGGYFVRKLFGLNRKLSNLISAGTGICGGTAVVAIAPVIDADAKDVAFTLSSTFLFDMVMVALYPLMGKAQAVIWGMGWM